MLKFTSLALGLLTVIAISPASQAATTANYGSTFDRPFGDLHAQVMRRHRQERPVRRHHKSERNHRHY